MVDGEINNPCILLLLLLLLVTRSFGFPSRCPQTQLHRRAYIVRETHDKLLLLLFHFLFWKTVN